MLPTSSPARIAANRANAARSSGPKSDEGKVRSRANSLKHGLTAQVVELDGIAANTLAVLDAAGKFNPAWVEAEITRTMGQISLLYRIERTLRSEAQFRAETHWADDREVDAEALGAKLSRNPSLVVAQLRRCPFGCSWLITRWECLRLGAANPSGWTESQTKLAFDLLGIPAEGRDRPVTEAMAYRRSPAEPAQSQLAIAEEMIADLIEQMNLVDESDNIALWQAQNGLVDLPTPELARLRRYEAGLRKRLLWLVSQRQATAPPVAAPAVARPLAAAEPAPMQNEAKPAETNPTPPAPRPESALPKPTRLPLNDPKLTQITPSSTLSTPEPHPNQRSA